MKTGSSAKKAAALLVIGVAMAAVGPAEAVMTFGSRSCGTWVADRASRGMEELNSSNWLLGFASGYAVASGEDWYKGIDANSILLYTDNYCRSHPLEPAAHAIFELANEVERKRRKK